ncbi:KamA family radical SAM protein [archaeon]|nr:KamA family radical SAM protein [archaeon]
MGDLKVQKSRVYHGCDEKSVTDSEAEVLLEWQEELCESLDARGILDKYPALRASLNISPQDMLAIDSLYPVRITPHFENLINWENPDDTLIRIVFPLADEFSSTGSPDTSGEKLNTKLKGLQHKYEPTALLKATDTCISYCRYCFRRRHVGKEGTESVEDFNKAIQYLEKHPEINNVLISGGDPFILNNQRIDYMLSELRKISSIKVIRIGSRVLSYLPSRINTDPKLVSILAEHSKSRKRIYLVSHFDHAREISDEAVKAINTLTESGVKIYNQAVLLDRVNDSAEALKELFEKLIDSGVTPYYFFQCRPVRGAMHHRVPFLRGSQAFEDARRDMNGLPKTARYAMSTMAGKIEIVRVFEHEGKRHAFLKFISAKNKKVIGELMHFAYDGEVYWIDDILKKDFGYFGKPEALEELQKNLIF